MNAVLSLKEDALDKGVLTHSSGNHAQAVALAARERGIPAHIVMPSDAPEVKKSAVLGYGARVVECCPTEREATAEAVRIETGGSLIHPSNEPMVIAGQGTMALELFEQLADKNEKDVCPLDVLVVPLGGGGMISGICAAAKGRYPKLRILAAEPSGADDGYRSKISGKMEPHREGHPSTVADGLKTTLGPNTWPYVRDMVEEVILVEEKEIVAATKLVWERMKLVIEPSAGVGVAVVLSKDFLGRVPKGSRVGVVLCGGNVDLDQLPW
eukprot:TRINITY_DN60231_c0_g2_i1.p1 TRINITY_DN60231_c0_g2~~TRINITY_DN60231_c0_g2_i1.p1  ORF type:complete len:269 (-),score=69.05 TRINITY_DN60231_c0_g2_i1:410-1216(-)